MPPSQLLAATIAISLRYPNISSISTIPRCSALSATVKRAVERSRMSILLSKPARNDQNQSSPSRALETNTHKREDPMSKASQTWGKVSQIQEKPLSAPSKLTSSQTRSSLQGPWSVQWKTSRLAVANRLQLMLVIRHSHQLIQFGWVIICQSISTWLQQKLRLPSAALMSLSRLFTILIAVSTRSTNLTSLRYQRPLNSAEKRQSR